MSHAGTHTPNYAILVSRFTSSGQWDRVLETAREWLSKEPENLNAHMAAGRALVTLDRHAEAEPHFNRVLAGNPKNYVAHRIMSVIHFNQKRFHAADESIHKAISLNPNAANNWYHLAWMFYKQRDLASGKKYAEKARELNPRSSNTINLIALCEPKNHLTSDSRRLEQYLEALELNPKNPLVHNNIGAYYMNTMKDYKTAEEHFRRALFFNPSLKLAKSNLFKAIKQRDKVYRCLSAPKDFLMKGFSIMRSARKKSILLYLLILPLCIFAYRFVLGALILWYIFVWPLVKVYEYLTIGDMRSQAGEIGARRGGFLGYRRWHIRLRLTIFAVALAMLWGGVALLAWNEQTQPIIYGLAGIFIVVLVVKQLQRLFRNMIKKWRNQYHARKRTKKFGDLLEPGGAKRKWWNVFRRKPNSQ